MRVDEIRAYLSHLATHKNVAASTQNIALSALMKVDREKFSAYFQTHGYPFTTAHCVTGAIAFEPRNLPTGSARPMAIRVRVPPACLATEIADVHSRAVTALATRIPPG
jgi:hypothetical protein